MACFLELEIPFLDTKGGCSKLSAIPVSWDTLSNCSPKCYLSQHPIADSAQIIEMCPVIIVQWCTALYSQTWISFWNSPRGKSVPPGLCYSLHGQLWILFALGLPHLNVPSQCLARSSNMLLREKWSNRNYKHGTQIKPILYPGGSRYYWHFWYIRVSSGQPKTSNLENQHLSRLLMEQER